MKQELKYIRYVSEQKEKLKELILSKKGLHLVEAPPGGGKTTTFLNIFKDLSLLKEYENTIFILACPNRTQCVQLEKGNIKAIIGQAKNINKNLKIGVMVYDKATHILNIAKDSNKQIVLIIDEAHQLIDSDIYRKKALKDLSDLQSFASITIHTTGTPRKLENRFKYDSIVKIRRLEQTAIAEKHTLIQLSNSDILSQIEGFARKLMESNKKLSLEKRKTPLFFLNDKEQIELLKSILNKKGYSVGIFSADTKDQEQFKYLENKELLKDNFDIYIATGVIECGINIKNKNLSIIMVKTNKNDFDFDSIEQSVNRARNKISNVYTLTIGNEEKENNKIRSKESIFKEWDYKVKQRVHEIENRLKYLTNLYNKNFAITELNTSLKIAEFNGEPYNYGVISINENGDIEVNENLLTNKKFKDYDKQFYYNPKLLNDELKKIIKTEKYEIWKLKDIGDPVTTEEIKENNKITKEFKEDLKEKAKNIISDLEKNQDINLLNEFLEEEEIINSIPGELKEKIQFLKKEEKTLKYFKKLKKVGFSDKETIKIILNSEKYIEISNKIKEKNYVTRNNSNDYNPNNKDTYSIIRRNIDPICKKQGSITNKIIEEIKEDLIINKLLKKEKSSSANKQIMTTLKIIYNLSSKTINEKDYIFVSSLKKKIKIE